MTYEIAGYEVVIIQDATIGDPQDSTMVYIADRIDAGDREGELIEMRWYIKTNDNDTMLNYNVEVNPDR